MSDERKEFLARVILDFFGNSSTVSRKLSRNSDDLMSSLTICPEMDVFLDSSSHCTLQAMLVDVNGKCEIKVVNEVGTYSGSAEVTIHVVKIGSDPITMHNIQRSISIFTMPSSPQDSLYHALHTIYLPLLTKEKGVGDGLVRYCQDLDAALGVSFRRSGAVGGGNVDESQTAGVLKLADETSFWYEASSAGSSADHRDRALAFHGIISEIEKSIDGCAGKGFEDASDAFNSVISKIDDLWRMEERDLQSLRARSSLKSPYYPQVRMVRLMELIGDEVMTISRKKLMAVDFWRCSFPIAERELLQSIELCKESWLEKQTELITVFWPQSDHPWAGAPYIDQRVSNFIQRLQSVLKVLTTHNSLKKLLSTEEQHALSLDKAYARFAEINALHINAYSNAAWEAAMSEYKSNMQPIEAIMSEKLRDRYDSFLIPKFEEALADQASRSSDPNKKLKATIPQPLQLLQSFTKYEELLKMPSIEKILEPERDKLLTMLVKYVAGLKLEFERLSAQFESKGAGRGPVQFSGKNFAGIVGTVAYIGQVQSKLEELCVSAKPHVSSLSRAADFEQQSLKLIQDLKEAKTKEVRQWTDEMRERLQDKDDPMALQVTGRLMSFDKSNGRLYVHYSESLVTFIREVRQLAALGCTIPKAFEQEVEKAYKHYRSAVVLKQAAAAYNSMDSQIIPCQLPMLIEDGQALEKLLRDQKLSSDGKQITWEDTKQLQKYAEILQDANTRLANKNARLRVAHGRMIQFCIQLMRTDLVRDRGEWRKGVLEMKKVKDEVVRDGFLHLASWVQHVDYQLYKALDFQYKLGLECCHETLSPMEVKLAFKQKKLSFDPPFEEIKRDYFAQLRRFISIPSLFRGVGDSDMFKGISDRNLDGLATVFQQAERLFKRLSDVSDRFASWVVLGGVDDLDALLEERLREVEDWESNFRLLETRLRDAKKLADSDRVDCITVNNGPVKASIEEQLGEFGKALCRSLRKSALADIEVLEEFVKRSLEALSVTPESVEEITNATARWGEIGEQCVAKRELKARMEEKGRLLKLQNSGAILDTYQLAKSWDELELRMSAHEKNVEEQKEKIRTLLESKARDFRVELEKFVARWKGMKPDGTGMGDRARAVEITKEVHNWAEEYDELKKKGATVRRECLQFGLEEPTYSELDALDDDITKTLAAWGFFEEFLGEMSALTEEDWMSIRERLYVMEDFLAKWAERLKGRDIDAVVRHMHTEIERLKKNVPYLKFVKGDSFTQDHWNSLFKMLNFPKGVSRGDLKLFHFLDASDLVVKRVADIQELQARAAAEMTIQDAIDEVHKWGMEAVFNIIEQSDSSNRRVVLIKEWREIQTKVGDFQSVLQVVRDSPYFSKFAGQAEEWDRILTLLGSSLSDLQSIQRKWLYLEPIFGRGALPHEQGRFLKVDEDFRRLMAEVESNPSVKAMADVMDLEERLKFQIGQLDRCQKSLSDFLEEKRSKFPRFYFIGDDDLLEILGQSKNPTIIQAHLKKLFQAIYAVDFSDDKKQIQALKSLEGETVELVNAVSVSDTVELWLAELSRQMVLALEMELVECMKNLDTSRFPSMILCAASQICFCVAVEQAIETDGLKQLEASQRDKLTTLTSHGQVEDQVLQSKLKSLILDLIHNIDVLDQLKENNVRLLKDWYWQKQLRYYFDVKSNKCVVRMCDAMNDYTYEYQGNDPKLVHTPLTDKCYLTLTQGLHLGYGGNPYGPAGTGKTESVKALGQALARQVLVFNCDEGIDYKSMGRIFTGLVKCGAWGCFDEFNRLEAEVLSAVSQQIQTIQAALKEKRERLKLLGQDIEVNKNSGIFVTLNPAGKGYLGRSELPDNLKQLFRSVAMAAPDNSLIAEVILYSEGYKHAKVIGTKVVELFTLSRQLLSKQQHYDWGLRALKTILLISGKLIHMESKTNAAIDMKVEMELVIKAVRLNTLAKLTFVDTQRFESLIKDIFPGTEVKDAVYLDLENAIRESLVELKLDPLPSQIKKVVQLNENLNQRMGCVIVGPSGCGKSTLLRILRAALQRMNQPIVAHTMNPKAMPRQQLLGHMDLDTREWFDGVLTASARQVVKEPKEVRSWIVCDGDIDPEWIESLNSVLDDNRLLTMPSGERIRFGPNVNFIFESSDLRFASPATVSRMGMIFLSDEDMDIGCLVKAWINRQPEAVQVRVQGWMEEVFAKALAWVLQAKAVVETTKVGIVLNALSHLVGAESKEQFVCALIRGLGSNLELEARQRLAGEVWQWCGERPLNSAKPLDCYFDPKSKTLVEYKGDAGAEFSVQDMVAQSPTERDLPVVETVDVLKQFHLFSTWLEHSEPFLLVGPEGCGKSMLLRYAFAKLRSVEIAMINCNAQTSAVHVIQKLHQSCTVATSQSGKVFRPKAERLVLYLKDINLPKPDKYDTIQLIAFLQQLILYQGFYDGLEWVSIERVQMVCSMNPSTTVGRHNLTTRFTAIVRIASVTYPAREQLQQVYAAYLNAVVRSRLATHPIWSDRRNIEKLAGTLLDLYDKVRDAFSVDEHRHYLVTPRDVSAIVVGLLRYEISTQHVFEVLTYEVQRVFRDRLVGPEAVTRFDRDVWGTLLRSQWKEKGDLAGALFSTWMYSATGKEDAHDPSKFGIAPLGRSSLEDLSAHVAQGLLHYEREFKELNILLFPEIVERVAYLNRILTEPGGSALLVGRAGVGRRSCFTLACYMLRFEVFSPKVGREYKSKQFLLDLKEVVKVAGVQGQQAALYLEEYQLVEPTILEMVNSLLSSGEVPGMFPPQELDAMLAPLKEAYSATGFKYRTLYSFFINRVQKNLHIVISLDPSHPDFLLRCESNPALFTRCTILWMESWSKPGMSTVSRLILKDTLEEIADPDLLLEHMQLIHQTCVERRAAPRQYITLLHTMAALYRSNRSRLVKQQTFLGGGLSKLDEAATMVDALSRDAQQQQETLREKQAQADRALQDITQNLEDAGRKKKEAEELSSKLGVKESEMKVKRQEVEAQLADCMPVLEAAKQAVGSIKKDNLNEIRSLKLPPEPIRDVLEGVLRLMNNQDTSWISMKRFLSQGSVINEILTFDARTITRPIREQVRQLLVSKQDSFRQEVIQRVSVAAAPMAAWVRAQIQYSLVLEKIEPLESELTRLDRDLDGARARLAECDRDIRVSDETVDRLKKEFGKLTQEAESLKLSLQRAMDTLDAASSLLGKLDEEKDRWKVQKGELEGQIRRLPVYMLLASGFITYLGGSPEDVRAALVESWGRACQLAEPFRMLHMMSTETERLTWKAQELPGDDLSAENAIVLLNSRQYPLIIDPSTQATTWLINNLRDAAQAQLSESKGGAGGAAGATELTTQQDGRFLQKLENSVRFGKVLVIQEVDQIEPLLFPLLRRDLARQGPRLVVQIGEKSVDFSEHFRLYLVTRNPMIEIPPDALPLVASVNFSVTRSGLEGQLLGVTIKNEKPELELQKSQLLETEERMKLRLGTLEKQLLEQLASSEGSILENKALIQALTDTKRSSQEIKSALADSQLLQVKLDAERDVYRGFARTGSRVFFLVQTLKAINYMYQFDLPTYLGLFQQTLQASGASSDVSQRLNFMVTTLKGSVFSFIGRSLFKADRLTFGMYLVRGMNPDMFRGDEWDFFVGLRVADTSALALPIPDWAPADRVPALQRLAATMPELAQGLGLADGAAWRPWLEHPAPETALPPRAGSLRPFQRLLVVQALRPDRLQSGMEAFVCEGLGLRTVNAATLDIASLARETPPATPIMLIVTPGSDPSALLEQAAEQAVGPGRYRQLAMGQGQAEAALAMLREGAADGAWVCLQNVHLVVAWLPALEKELSGLQRAPAFRLWLTTEPHPRFPPVLLQQSVKATFEAPPGLKKNLQAAYSLWTPAFVRGEGGAGGAPAGGGGGGGAGGSSSRAQLLFLVAWFHAVVQERRTFIPQGWSKFHEFSFADLRSTADIVSSFDADQPPWVTLHGLLDNAIYGGRIDNVFDQRILRTYLRQVFSPACVSIGGRGAAQCLPNTPIRCPASPAHDEYTRLVAGLPEVDAPALFGLPPNIERVLQQSNSARIAGQLKTMATASVADAGWDRERMAAQLGPLLRLWQTLVSGPGAELLRARPAAAAAAAAAPVDAFAAMEAEDAGRLVGRVHRALEALERVLRGAALLSNPTRDVGLRLAAGAVPQAWADAWEGPEAPALWLQGVVHKALAIRAWAQGAERGAALAAPVRLSDMLAPQVFLNALRQQTARATRVAVDELRLVCAWGDGARVAATAGTPGCTLAGLSLQGALLTAGGLLAETRPDTPTVVPAPPCALAYIPRDQPDPQQEGASVVLPLYEDLARARPLAQLRVPCKTGEQDRWILAGAALFICAE